jgi:hypothetical protein
MKCGIGLDLQVAFVRGEVNRMAGEFDKLDQDLKQQVQ